MKISAALFFAALLSAAVISCGGVDEGTDGSDDQVIDVSGGLPSLVDLGSTTCVPCRQMESELALLDSLSGDQLNVRFIDVNEHPEEASDFGVRLIPTQVFISETGEELFRHEGFMSCDEMMSKWSELGYEFPRGI